MTISMSKKALWLAPLSAAMLMLAGCNNSAAPEESAEADTATEAPLDIKIATESSYKPFSYTDADGKLIGYEIELVDALCAQMKAECEVISQDWDGLIPGLNAQKFDAAIAGMSITPERQEVVDFSDPYFYSGIILIGKKGDDLSVDALAGQPIASQRSTVSSQYLQDEHADADIKLYDTQDNAYLDLTSGRVRGMMSDPTLPQSNPYHYSLLSLPSLAKRKNHYIVTIVDSLLPDNNCEYAKRLFLIFYSGIIKRFIGSHSCWLPVILLSILLVWQGRQRTKYQNLKPENPVTTLCQTHQNLRNV